MQWIQIIGKVLAALDPETKARISKGLDAAQEHAKQTVLPIDDIALAIFRMFTGL